MYIYIYTYICIYYIHMINVCSNICMHTYDYVCLCMCENRQSLPDMIIIKFYKQEFEPSASRKRERERERELVVLVPLH